MMNTIRPVAKQKKEKCMSPYRAAASNFVLAKRLAKENLEHEPLPDTIADAMYRKMQMQGCGDPGLFLKDGGYATGVGYKGYPGYGATRCTKLKVYRPKTCIHGKLINKNDRPSSVTSFDKKWRFIRQEKVTPIELAICWDMTPVNRKDEPERSKHLDGSNGSQAPAVFSLVHTPKGDNLPDVVDGGPKGNGPRCNEYECEKESDTGCDSSSDAPKCRPKMAWQKKEPVPCSSSIHSKCSSSKSLERAKSAYNLQQEERKGKTSEHSSLQSTGGKPANKKKMHQSSPDLTDCSNSYKYCSKECYRQGKKIPNTRLCVACELKNVKLRERPKSEYKMAFKAGVPNTKSRENRQDYPEHWRLASIYQHSYKPIHLRKKPLLASVFQ